MQKKLILISSIIIFILSFIYQWYADQLFNALFVFSMVIPLVLFVAFVTCLIFTILNLVKEYKKIINYISILILGFTILLTLFFPFRLSKVKL